MSPFRSSIPACQLALVFESRTDVRLRKEISKSKATNSELAEKIGVSENTIRKWKNRGVFEGKSSRPCNIRYSLSETEMLIAVKLRTITWWSLDEITEAIRPKEPVKILELHMF